MILNHLQNLQPLGLALANHLLILKQQHQYQIGLDIVCRRKSTLGVIVYQLFQIINCQKIIIGATIVKLPIDPFFPKDLTDSPFLAFIL